MKKELLTLLLLLLLSFPSISQTVTVHGKDSLICLPDTIARLVIQDLEKGDLYQKDIVSYQNDIKTLTQQIEIKDSLIQNHTNTIYLKDSIISEKKQQLDIDREQIKMLEDQNKLSFLKGAGTGVGITALIVLILLL